MYRYSIKNISNEISILKCKIMNNSLNGKQNTIHDIKIIIIRHLQYNIIIREDNMYHDALIALRLEW